MNEFGKWLKIATYCGHEKVDDCDMIDLGTKLYSKKCAKNPYIKGKQRYLLVIDYVMILSVHTSSCVVSDVHGLKISFILPHSLVSLVLHNTHPKPVGDINITIFCLLSYK